MEALRRLREPVAIVLLVVAGIRLVTGVLAVPILAGDEGYGSFTTAALFESGRTFDLILLLATSGVAASCLVAPATPRGRALVSVALIEAAVGVLASVVLGFLGLFADSPGRGIEFLYLLAGLVLPVLAVLGLIMLLRSDTTPSTVQIDAPAAPAGPPPPPSLAAAWQPEEATGRVWSTAGEAARGAPASVWPAEPGPAGWQPIPGRPEPPPGESSRHQGS